MYALIYLAAVNVVTFFTYGIDKWKAKRARRRISEATLLGLAVIGGSIGAWIGIKVWHHKTLHKKFKYGVPPDSAPPNRGADSAAEADVATLLCSPQRPPCERAVYEQ